MINIFKAGDISYPEKLNKPVRYDSKFLKDIASKTVSIKITNEHSNEVIGVLENFIYENGYLKANEPDGIELKGMGFSPVFDCDLVDMGDYYQPKSGIMSEIGFTKNPRSNILYNSIVGDNVSESLEIVIKEKEELQKRIGVLENENRSYKNLLKQKDDEIDKVKQSYSDMDGRLSELEKLQEKADLYDEMQKSIKEDLIEEMCGDNDTLKEVYANIDMKTLQAIKANPLVQKGGSGIPSNIADLDDGTAPVDKSNDDEYTEEEFLKDYAAAGWD